MRRRKNYRGSRRGGMGTLIPVLIVLCVIAAVVLFFVNDSETYTKNGETVVVAPKNENNGNETDVVVEQVGGEENEEKPVPETKLETEKAVRGYFVGISSVKDSALLDNAIASASAQENVNTIVFEVKAEDGTLAFGFEHGFIEGKQLSGDDETLKTAIAKAREAGFGVELYISCFKDNGAAHSNFENAIIQQDNGWVWRDESNTRWLTAYSEASRGYITGIIEKLAGFAPDRIILANVSFPTVGNTGSIDYGENPPAKSEVIEAFAEDAVKAAGVTPLSAVYENYDANHLPASGQDISIFRRTFKTLYIRRDGGKNTLSYDTARTAVADDSYKLIPTAPSFDSGVAEFMIKK